MMINFCRCLSLISELGGNPHLVALIAQLRKLYSDADTGAGAGEIGNDIDGEHQHRPDGGKQGVFKLLEQRGPGG